MALYAEALRDLGRFLGDSPRARRGRRGRRLGRAAGVDARRAACPSSTTAASGSAPRSPPNDLALAGVAEFHDLDRLTIFADNLVPHVLRVDGVLRYDPALAARIDAGELLPPGERGARDPRLRGARLRAARRAARDAGARARHRALEPRPGAEVQERAAAPHADGLLLSLQPPVESGPPRRLQGADLGDSGLRPVCSATSSSSSVRRLARPLMASATGSGRWTQSASGPSGFLPSTRTGWPGLPTTVEFGGHVVDHHRVRADLRARRRSRSGRAAWRRRRSSPRRPPSGGACRARSRCRPSVTPW